jgi:hypothetical protein
MKNTLRLICLVCLFLSFCLVNNAENYLKIKDTNPIKGKGEIKAGKVWVFILAGQSNMAGRGKVEAEDTVTSPRILSINAKGELIPAKEPIHFYEPKMKALDCGLSFGKELLKYIPNDVTVLIIPTAIGGRSINQWINDSTFRGVKLLTNFREKLELGKRYGEIKAVLWHQGESDANPNGIKSRQEKLKTLFTSFRNFAGNPALPVLMGELGSYSKNKEMWMQLNEQIRLYSASDVNTSVISTSDFKDRGDQTHFTSEGQREMGKRFAKAYIQKFEPANK